MKKQIEEIRKEVKEMEKELENQDTTMVLLEKSLDNSNRRHNMVIRCLVGIIIVLLAIVAYDTYMDANTGELITTEETTQEGVYNFVDSEGNLVSSDLSLEEMKELIEINGED